MQSVYALRICDADKHYRPVPMEIYINKVLKSGNKKTKMCKVWVN